MANTFAINWKVAEIKVMPSRENFAISCSLSCQQHGYHYQSGYCPKQETTVRIQTQYSDFCSIGAAE